MSTKNRLSPLLMKFMNIPSGKSALVCVLVSVFALTGCFYNFNFQPLEERERILRLAYSTMVDYLGADHQAVRRRFGEPTEIHHKHGEASVHYQLERVKYDETWCYFNRRGISGWNASGSHNKFHFLEGVVVAVSAG